LGENLRRARLRAGLSQDEVFADLDDVRIVQRRHYQELEAGRANPTFETLVILARFFDTTVAALVDVEKRHTDEFPERRPPEGFREKVVRARRLRVADLLAERAAEKKKRRAKRRRLKRKGET